MVTAFIHGPSLQQAVAGDAYVWNTKWLGS
jgi:hypothetical protein